MKTKLLTLFSLLALLLVSAATLADGRPTGIRITRAVSGGGTNVEIDVSVTATLFPWQGGYSTTVIIGNAWLDDGAPGRGFYHYSSPTFSVPLPWAVEWGDGYYFGQATLFGPPGGPFQGTFAHTYLSPGAYTITVGDALDMPSPGLTNINTGSVITASTAYWGWVGNTGTFYPPSTYYTFGGARAAAVTNTAIVNTGTGIPTLNLYGLLAMALVLVGAGVLLYRKPQQA